MAASSATAQQNKAAAAGGPFPIEKLQISGVAALDVKKLKATGLYKVESVTCSQRKDRLQIKGISEVKVDKKVEPAPKLSGQKVDANKIPIYLITGSSIVDQILGRDVKKTQFSRTAFQTEGPSCHLLSCGYENSECRTHIAREVTEDKIVGSGRGARENAVYLPANREKELNSRANVSYMWQLIDERAEKCRRIRQDIRAVGGTCQDIPPYLIR